MTVSDPNVRPFTGIWNLQPDRSYFLRFYVLSSWATGSEVPEVQLSLRECE